MNRTRVAIWAFSSALVSALLIEGFVSAVGFPAVAIASRYICKPGEIHYRRVRERDVLAFLALVAVTCTMLTSAVAFAFVV